MIYLQLFWSFVKIGFTSFGGLAMIPLISSEMLGHGWMSITEVSDIVAIAEMTPGPLSLNCATFAGIRVAGIFGALCSNLGILSPTFTICAAAGFFFARFKESSLLKRMMVGVRPASIGLIWYVILDLARTTFILNGSVLFLSVAIFAVSLFALLKLKFSIPQALILAAVLGIIFFR